MLSLKISRPIRISLRMFSNLQNRGLSFPSLPLSNLQAWTNHLCYRMLGIPPFSLFLFSGSALPFPSVYPKGLVMGASNKAFTSPQIRPQHGASMWAPGKSHLCTMGFSKDNPVVWDSTTLSGWQCPLKPRMAAASLEPPS